MTCSDATLAGVILAGGHGRRLGGRKSARQRAGRTLVDHGINRIRPQLSRLLLSGSPDDPALMSCGLPVIADPVTDMRGPLAGILGAMNWLVAEASQCQ